MMKSIFMACAFVIASGLSFGATCKAQSQLTPVVVDRDGKVMGPVLQLSPTDEKLDVGLRLQAGRPAVDVQIYKAQFATTAVRYVSIGWQSSDCTGPSYIDQNALVPVAVQISRVGEPGTLYFPDSRYVPRQLQMKSILTSSGCRTQGASFPNARPTLTASIKALGFAPPFSVEFR